jgi:chromosome segregation ATPase
MSEEHLETPLALPAWAERAIEARAEVERLRARVAELEGELAEERKDSEGLHGYIDAVDTQISEALEKIGAFPPKPAGAPDRVDAICEKLAELEGERDEARREVGLLEVRVIELQVERAAAHSVQSA